MINFIVCDDCEADVKKVANMIDKVMIGNHLCYKKHLFYDYDKIFVENAMEAKLPNKVYILDIQTDSRSGIDVARDIRKHDMNSIIIFLTGFNELGMNILTDELMVLTFINKLDNSDERLASALNKSLDVLNVRQVVRFETQGVVYSIPSEDILYITRDTVERKCIIKTDYNDYKVKMTLMELSKILGNNFKETHRSCIVNMSRVVMMDLKNKLITFDNNETIDLISNTFKKEMSKL